MSHQPDQERALSDHLTELRRRLMLSAFVVFAFFLIALPSVKYVLAYLQADLVERGLELNAFGVADPLMIYLNLALVIGLVAAGPFLLYQLWAFVAPGLHPNERKATLAYIPIISVLFLFGLAFAYYWLFPLVLDISTDLGQDLGLTQIIGASNYFTFLLQLTIPFGLLFQLPVVTMFLTRIGVVTPYFLSKIRKYAYFALFVVAAFITPPDLTSHLMVSLPLFFLYEISLSISRVTYRGVLRREKEAQVKEQMDLMKQMNEK
ncbi:twin-arginine translocase subunit TatC [Exiguobacterium sp. SL-10]|uniref:twin-arginine translocase subunit TatC n=1 Tax=Exiguobacterium sp. SL-10 TaxID=2510962 RepID=UPI00103B52D7|nr:twin-arginine translocase subunit TatC [Exiguobacterium sp. SL-10]TCI29254.1 twin-arginine translocase subunit TatC [Exiguobacterium sp. SL-10]